MRRCLPAAVGSLCEQKSWAAGADHAVLTNVYSSADVDRFFDSLRQAVLATMRKNGPFQAVLRDASAPKATLSLCLVYVVVVGLLICAVEEFKSKMLAIVQRCSRPRREERDAFSSVPLREFHALPEIPGDTAVQRYRDFVPETLRVLFSAFAVVHARDIDPLDDKIGVAAPLDGGETQTLSVAITLQPHAEVLYAPADTALEQALTVSTPQNKTGAAAQTGS